MSKKSIKIFINEIFSKPPRNNYPTNKTDVYHTDGIWSIDVLGVKDNRLENNEGYRYFLVVIDKFSRFGWTAPLKNKNAQTKEDSCGTFSLSSK